MKSSIAKRTLHQQPPCAHRSVPSGSHHGSLSYRKPVPNRSIAPVPLVPPDVRRWVGRKTLAVGSLKMPRRLRLPTFLGVSPVWPPKLATGDFNSLSHTREGETRQ